MFETTVGEEPGAADDRRAIEAVEEDVVAVTGWSRISVSSVFVEVFTRWSIDFAIAVFDFLGLDSWSGSSTASRFARLTPPSPTITAQWNIPVFEDPEVCTQRN